MDLLPQELLNEVYTRLDASSRVAFHATCRASRSEGKGRRDSIRSLAVAEGYVRKHGPRGVLPPDSRRQDHPSGLRRFLHAHASNGDHAASALMSDLGIQAGGSSVGKLVTLITSDLVSMRELVPFVSDATLLVSETALRDAVDALSRHGTAKTFQELERCRPLWDQLRPRIACRHFVFKLVNERNRAALEHLVASSPPVEGFADACRAFYAEDLYIFAMSSPEKVQTCHDVIGPFDDALIEKLAKTAEDNFCVDAVLMMDGLRGLRAREKLGPAEEPKPEPI